MISRLRSHDLMETRHKEAYRDFILINVPLQLYKKTPITMVRILHCNTHIRTWFSYENRKYVLCLTDGKLLTLNVLSTVAWWRKGGGGSRPYSNNFLGALKSKGGAKHRNCQCEILYKICKVQIVNKFKVVVTLAFL